MKQLMKCLSAILLAILLCTIGILQPLQVLAAEDYTKILEEQKTVAAKESTTFHFTIPQNSKAGVEFDIDQKVNLTYTLTEKKTASTSEQTINAEKWKNSTLQPSTFFYASMYTMPAGDYAITVTSDVAATYKLIVYLDNTSGILQLDKGTLTLTAGQSHKLTLTNAGSTTTWTSSKPAVATVNKKGKVVAKKAGKTTITATSNGQTVTCTVTVKKNIFTIAKPNTKNTKSNTVTFSVYKASYDANGNLVCNIRILNRTPFQIQKVTYGVKAILPNGKTFGTASDKQDISISADSKKDLTLTIPSSSLKKKNVDLRNSVVTIDNPTYYYSYN